MILFFWPKPDICLEAIILWYICIKQLYLNSVVLLIPKQWSLAHSKAESKVVRSNQMKAFFSVAGIISEAKLPSNVLKTYRHVIPSKLGYSLKQDSELLESVNKGLKKVHKGALKHFPVWQRCILGLESVRVYEGRPGEWTWSDSLAVTGVFQTELFFTIIT